MVAVALGVTILDERPGAGAVAGLLLILAGGIAYSGGLAFFAAHRIRYNHFIWHLFVMAGTTFHYLAVLWYGHSSV